MALDLLKRAEKGAALTATDHDTNFTNIETEVNAKATSTNPVFTGTVTIPDGALAIADTNGLQAALDTKLGEDANGAAIVDYTLPHVTGVSGTLTQAAHGGRPILITAPVTVPVTDGFICSIKNKSGSNQTVQPLSGNLIHEGTTKASISLPTNREVQVHSDGTDVWVSGALA